MSEVRRKLLLYSCGEEESDIDYVKRQFREFTAVWPAFYSGMMSNNTCLHLVNVDNNDPNWPKRRCPLLINRSNIKSPMLWWGPVLTNLHPDEQNYSLIHIPQSITKITIKHSASGYYISVPTMTGTNPIYVAGTEWIPANTLKTISFTNINLDRYLGIAVRYRNDDIIPFTTSDALKNLLNLQITIE